MKVRSFGETFLLRQNSIQMADRRPRLCDDARAQGGTFELSNDPARPQAAKVPDANDDWFFLHKLHMCWMQADPSPTTHPLYDQTRERIRGNRDVTYYEGMYDALRVLQPAVLMVLDKDGPFANDPSGACNDLLQLYLGHVIGHMLRTWPDELVPKATPKAVQCAKDTQSSAAATAAEDEADAAASGAATRRGATK